MARDARRLAPPRGPDDAAIVARRTGVASELDLDPQSDWQLVTDGARIEVVQASALSGFMPATPGDVWEYRSTQQGTPPMATLEVTCSAEVVAVERVTVPAGSFAAMRVHGEVFSRMHLRTPAGSPPLESVQRDASHWVRGLGLVQSISPRPAGAAADQVAGRV